MNLIQHIGAKLLFGFNQKSATTLNSLAEHFRTINNSNYSSTLKKSSDYLSAYEAVAFVGRCASTIALDIGAMDWEIVNGSTNKLVEGSKSEQLLNNPQLRISNSVWIANIVLHYLLDGNSFIIPNLFSSNAYADKVGSFAEANLVIPSLIDVYDYQSRLITAGTQTSVSEIGHYQVTDNSMLKNVNPDSVIQIQMPNPNNSLRGMGIVQQNSSALDADRFISIFNNAFFQNGAQSNLLVQPATEMAPAQFDLWQRLFEDKFTGAKNWGKPIYTVPGATVQELNLSHKDMEFLEQRKFTRECIAAMFYLPDLIAGLNNSGKYDTSKEQLELYQNLCLTRFYIPIAEGITRLIQKIDPGLRFVFKPNHTVDREKTTLWTTPLFDRGILKGNEVRLLLGLETDETDEILNTRFMSLQYVPADDVISPVVLPEPKPAESAKSCGCGHDHGNDTKSVMTNQTAMLKRARAVKKRIEPTITKGITKFYKDMESRVLAGIEKAGLVPDIKGANMDDMYDFTEEKKEAIKNAKNFFTSAITLGIKDVNDMLSTEVDSTYKNPNIKLVVDKLATKYANRIVQTRKEEVANILSKWKDSGEGISSLTAAIKDNFSDLQGKEGWKAQRIARTEASYAYDQAAKLGYQELGVKLVDVIGCEDEVGDCNAKGIPVDEIDSLEFHPNHTGSIVIAN